MDYKKKVTFAYHIRHLNKVLQLVTWNILLVCQSWRCPRRRKTVANCNLQKQLFGWKKILTFFGRSKQTCLNVLVFKVIIIKCQCNPNGLAFCQSLAVRFVLILKEFVNLLFTKCLSDGASKDTAAKMFFFSLFSTKALFHFNKVFKKYLWDF